MLTLLRGALLILFLAMLPWLGRAEAHEPNEVKALCQTDEGLGQLMDRIRAEKPPGTLTDKDYQVMGTALQEMCGGVVARWEGAYPLQLCAAPPPPFTAFCWEDRECDVDWNDECEYSGDARIPPELKLQACRVDYRVAAARGDEAGFEVTPKFPIEDETGLTNRFGGFHLRLFAKGPYKVFNRTGAKFRIEDVRLLAVPIDTSNARRRELKCLFFQHPEPAPPRPAPPASPAYPPSDLRSCGLVWVRDAGEMSIWRATRFYTSVGVSTQDSNGRWVEAVVAMRANDQISIRRGAQRARCLS